MARVLFGTAGWSYEDWRGRVYPADAGPRFDPLAFLAGYFDLVEVNSTFYRLPEPARARSWLARVKSNPDFLFLLKVPRDWTHSPEEPSRDSLDRFRGLAEILAAEGRLGALLIQFPWSFRNDAPNRRRLSELTDRLADLPLAVEVRHGGFERPEWYAFLRSRRCLPVNIDQPQLADSIPLGEETGADAAYFRFHGRRADTWFDAGAGRDARYDYCYGDSELDELGRKIAGAAARVGLVFVVTNNHFRGQAAVNALQLKFRFAGRKLPVPADLLRQFPALKEAALPPAGAQGDLFGPEA